MRQFLVDYVRTKTASKRDGDRIRVDFKDDLPAAGGRVDLSRILDIHNLLDRLAREDPRKAQVVELRFFAGLEFQEIAEQLRVSLITVKRDWRFCRAWLFDALKEDGV
jgi:RNA polymerase sigma factor (TIGR02999 family)